jgi:hypothetical protein
VCDPQIPYSALRISFIRAAAQIVVTPHDYDIDRHFKEERENMLDRMDAD